MSDRLLLEPVVEILKAVGEPSRLRILALLARGDLTVSDLTTILGQSQPRVSRHLKLLHEAHLINRYQEGAWAYFCLSQQSIAADLMALLKDHLDQSDALLSRDDERLQHVKAQRREKAANYFSKNAAQWDELRLLHVPDNAIETALKRLIGDSPFQTMLDIGTGTGSLLKLFAPLYMRGLGVDINRDMLSVARVNLDNSGISHAQVRQGDALALPAERDSYDLITIYQVLHFMDEPQQAIREAARVLRPNGRLVIVDFAAHDLEFLREEQAHLRLGFSDQQMATWFKDAGLILEETQNFAPDQKQGEGRLTVKLWLARDPRFLIANHSKMEIA